MWKEGDKHTGIVDIMGGFHIILVNLKILYKKYGLLCLRGWWVKSKIIADGSSDNVLEGGHYSRGTRLNKQIFEALVGFKWKSLENDFWLNFISKVKKPREEIAHGNLPALCNDEDLKQIKQQIWTYSRTMGKWVTDYIRDVSKFLSRIAAYRDRNIELLLHTQRELLSLLFAFYRQNCVKTAQGSWRIITSSYEILHT